MVRSPGRYGSSRRLAMTPSRPAPSKRRNQSSASARSRVAGEMCTGGAASASACSSRSRRCASGASRRSSSPSASRSQATNDAGDCEARSFTREAAGWMRSRSASKSSPAAPTITTSPSTTQRSGSERASGASSSGKYRFIGFSSRLCSRISSPSRNTSVRNPSHLGSNSQPSPPGSPSAALDSIGWSGGSNGRRTSVSGFASPVHEAPERAAERTEVEAADRVGHREHRVPDEDRDDDHVLDDEVVQADEEGRALGRIHLRFGGAPEAIVLVVSPASQVRAGPLVGLLRGFPRAERAHERLRIGLAENLRGQLQIGIEMTLGVEVARIRGEVDRAHDRFQLALDARPPERLLDDRLDLLPNRLVDGLEQDFQSLSVLGADTIRAALPPARIEQGVGLVDIEFPARVRRHERAAVHEVRRRIGLPAPDLALNRRAIHQQCERGANHRIGEERMNRLEARPLAVDLGPRIGLVDLDVLDVRGPPDDDPAPGAVLEPAQDVVLHVEAPGVVVLPGLQHRARRRDGIAAALHLDGSKKGRFATWYTGLISACRTSPGLKSTKRYGPVPTGRRFAGASRDLPLLNGSKTWRGSTMPAALQNASAQ